MKTLSAVFLLNKRTRMMLTLAVDPGMFQGPEERKKQVLSPGSYVVLSCVTYQWTCMLFFSSVS